MTIDGQAVQIRRSARRTRSLQARYEGDVIVVLAPAALSAREETRLVEDLVRRMLRKSRSQRNDATLAGRAEQLSRRFVPGAPVPSSIRWVSNMTTRWASCSPGDASIRLSDAMVGMPDYVVDAVILHEVAHLVERGHGPRFQKIVRQNPEHDRADAFLAGASFGARRAVAAPSGSLEDDEPDAAGDDPVAADAE